jgi:predicted esterase
MSDLHLSISGPHDGQPVLARGAALSEATAVMILAHGRGASAEDILMLTSHFLVPGFAFLAPQAAGNVWYPNPFSAPVESNEPWLSSALAGLGFLVDYAAQAGIPPERVILLGFSQGASLSMEFTARHARRYGGLAGLSGSLIGPDDAPRDYPGSLDGTPVFLGCSDVDPFVAKGRVVESSEVLMKLGARVTLRLYPGLDHSVSADEIRVVQEMMRQVAQGSPATRPAREG